MRPRCPSKVRPFRDDTEMRCDLPARHAIRLHEASYRCAGSVARVSWADVHRRAFEGEWWPCSRSACVLPNGHGVECQTFEGTAATTFKHSFTTSRGGKR
ncbi:MAG: hypothetical protein M3404_01820 [Actinomycetota bacterium]|nr:hypothetical protein [Actinomycetota bacterium]